MYFIEIMYNNNNNNNDELTFHLEPVDKVISSFSRGTVYTYEGASSSGCT